MVPIPHRTSTNEAKKLGGRHPYSKKYCGGPRECPAVNGCGILDKARLILEIWRAKGH